VYTNKKGVMSLLRATTAVFAVTLALFAQTSQYERARVQFEKTQYTSALQILKSKPNLDAADYNLMGRVQYMLGNYNGATESFEKATKLDPKVSTHWHWLGRTFGRRAEVSSFITAPGYASKARQNFEKAVDLDPKNSEAVNDLFEYYLQAPGFLGGGLDKAQGLLGKIESNDPAEKHYAMARLAEERKDFKTAEQQLRRAMEAAPRQVGRILDLAKFLAKQGRTQESDKVFEQARNVSPDSPQYLWERANLLIEQKRDLKEARKLLEKYLASQVPPDSDNKAEARKLLAKLPAA
jgi:tetratricopeptide (TPR) repeat protein